MTKYRETQGRLTKAILTLLAAFLTFGGPTYLIYFLKRFAIPYPFLVLLGLASLTAGIMLFMHLFRRKEETGASS